RPAQLRDQDGAVGLNPFFTVGHSTRSVEELAGLLGEAGANTIADVRTIPRSRTNPQFNLDALPDALAERQIAYRHIAALGGMRGRGKGGDPSPNTFWDNASFRNYADYALTEPFRAGLADLIALSERHVCAVMCAEAVWWRCHRRIVADYLMAAGRAVFHILGPGKIAPATMTAAARPAGGGWLIYPLA
ncbi:MAG: DUF488 domain-containing protein, partial [Caulobacteraceae bacterium]